MRLICSVEKSNIWYPSVDETITWEQQFTKRSLTLQSFPLWIF